VTKPEADSDPPSKEASEPTPDDASGERATPEATGDDRISSMADDPTAVWDGDALASAGFDVKSGKMIEPKPAPSRSEDTPKPPPRRGLSWPVTIILAIVVGLAVYFAVLLLK
jgi:hypothetical protein